MQTLVSWFIALLLLLVAVAGSTLPLAAISYFGLPFLAALPFGGLLSLLAAALMIGIYLWLFLYLVEHALNLGSAGRGARLLLMMVMNLRRNMVRTALSYAATVVLVFVVTVIWTILTILNAATKEKTQDLKAIVTERWQLPSQMPYPYFKEVKDHLPELASENVMSWQFYGGSTVADASKRNRENMLFLFAL
jgi:putative ABC transport system permease protein